MHIEESMSSPNPVCYLSLDYKQLQKPLSCCPQESCPPHISLNIV